MKIKISNKWIGENYPVFITAEAGINHNGSLKIAKKLVNVAKKAGANCIKFQTHLTEKEMIKTNLQQGCRRGVGGDMATDSITTLIGSHNHGHGIPTNNGFNAAF